MWEVPPKRGLLQEIKSGGGWGGGKVAQVGMGRGFWSISKKNRNQRESLSENTDPHPRGGCSSARAPCCVVLSGPQGEMGLSCEVRVRSISTCTTSAVSLVWKKCSITLEVENQDVSTPFSCEALTTPSEWSLLLQTLRG